MRRTNDAQEDHRTGGRGDRREHGRRGGHRPQPEAHPLDFRSTSRNFRGGRLECWYGGGVLDLRDATLAPEGATLQVRAVFGGGQILVPADWKVVSTVRGMGGLQDIREAKGYAADAPELVIEGILIAGGFAVSSELEDGSADFQADMEALRDNDELVLELDPDPTLG